MFTEPTAGAEQEIIHGILAQRRRLKRVIKRLLPKPAQQALDIGTVAAGLGMPLQRHLPGPGVAIGRQ